MVENPEQAAYIIEWVTLDNLKNFQSSPACIEFLWNLPEHSNLQVSIKSGAALRHLAVDNASLLSLLALSCFLTFERVTKPPTLQVKGRVTVTTFMVPRKVDNMHQMFYNNFESMFNNFAPHSSRFITRHQYSWARISSVWFRVLAEDHWVEEKFGKLELTQEDDQGQTSFCHFFVWPLRLGATQENEEASATDPQARESWNQHIVLAMPPATAWEQERWDIQEVPRSHHSEDKYDLELTPEQLEEEKERRRLQAEDCQLHPSEFGKWL
ncbi:hypothetical protein BJX61DRAFT_545400 [Aspergillus egyptiacus]|nr:hypothetical protein BJX61DRAFT_545400 [Aspergillus egyptiacus]